MQWTSDTAAGDWIADAIDTGAAWGRTMHGVVPRGFAAYARVFHPPRVNTLPGGAIPDADTWARLPEDERGRLSELITVDDTTWAETAAAFGTTMHPLAQWQRIVRVDDLRGAQSVTAPDGRQFDAPAEGDVDPTTLAAIVRIARAHTTTPGSGVAGVWEGWGGLLTHADGGSGRVRFTWGEGDPEAARRTDALLGRSTRDPFENAFRKPVPVPGILSDEISDGPRLMLHARNHILFHGDLSAFADPSWTESVPWTDPEGWGTASPSLLWPDDRAWVIVTEVDYDSTIVGGTPELISSLLTDPDIEALGLPTDAVLHHGGDTVNVA